MAFSVALVASPAYAQDLDVSAPDQEDVASQNGGEVIIVTGSRLQRNPEVANANPVRRQGTQGTPSNRKAS